MAGATNYATAVSLGGYCQFAHQAALAKIACAPSPFDWIVTPLDAVAPILQDRGARFCRRISRFDNGLNKGRHVLCEDYGVVSVHDFPLNEFGAPSLHGGDDVRAKLMHKTARMLEAVTAPGRKLFLRLGGGGHRRDPWPYLREEAPVKYSALVELCATLDRLCVEGFDLLFVYYEKVTTFSEDAALPGNVNLKPLRLPPREERIWEGSQTAWSYLWAQLPAAIARTGE